MKNDFQTQISAILYIDVYYTLYSSLWVHLRSSTYIALYYLHKLVGIIWTARSQSGKFSFVFLKTAQKTTVIYSVNV